jgi:hypothetical protein
MDQQLISITSLFIAIAAIIGTIIAYMHSTKGQIQERALNAMEQEIDVLRSRLDDMENENRRLEQIIATICKALKKRGLSVQIDGNIITVESQSLTGFWGLLHRGRLPRQPITDERT